GGSRRRLQVELRDRPEEGGSAGEGQPAAQGLRARLGTDVGAAPGRGRAPLRRVGPDRPRTGRRPDDGAGRRGDRRRGQGHPRARVRRGARVDPLPLLRVLVGLPVARGGPVRVSMLADAVEIARAAGRILREGYGRPGAIDYKGGIDLVTEFDRKSEAYVRA